MQALFKLSAFPRAKHIFIYFPVKTRQTSAKYPSAGNANHGIFQLKNESIYLMSAIKKNFKTMFAWYVLHNTAWKKPIIIRITW